MSPFDKAKREAEAEALGYRCCLFTEDGSDEALQTVDK